MDYFTELLESYRKIKKRTFKIEYLSEEEAKKAKSTAEEKPEPKTSKNSASIKAAAEQLANAALASAPPLPSSEAMSQALVLQNVNGEDSGVKIYKNASGGKSDGNISVFGLDGKRGWALLKAADGSLNAEVFALLVQALGQEAEGDPTETAANQILSAEQAAIDEFNDRIENTIGGASKVILKAKYLKEGYLESQAQQLAEQEYNEDPEAWVGKAERGSYGRQVRLLQKYIDEQINTSNDPELKKSWENIAANPISYLAGGAIQSLESKLVNGKGICISDTGDKKTCDLSRGAAQDAVISNEFLLSFLQPPEPDQDRCSDIQKTLGVDGFGSKKKLVLFGSNLNDSGTPTEGVVITPNALQKFALSKVVEECPEKGGQLANNSQDSFNLNQKNAIKGTIYEDVPNIAFLMNSLRESDDKAPIRAALKSFLNKILVEDKIPLLESIAQDSDSFSLESYAEHREALDQLGIIQSKQRLAAWVIQESTNFNKFLKLLPSQPEGVVHLGLSPKTGGRADNGLIYSDEASANAAAEAVGASVTKTSKAELLANAGSKQKGSLETKLKLAKVGSGDIFLIPFGQKRMNTTGNTKAGEINNSEVLQSYFESKDTGSVETGFLDKLDEAVPVSPEVSKYNKDIEKSLRQSTDHFTEVKTYSSVTGETKIKDPAQVNKLYADKLKGRLGFDVLQGSNLGALFFDKGKPRDYEDKMVQQRIKEGIARTSRFSIYRKHLTGNEGAEKKSMAQTVLIRNLLTCGYNVRDMAQVKATNDGTVQAWSHNSPMDKILKARKSGTLEIAIAPGSNTAYFNIGGRTVMSFSQEGTWSGSAENKARRTRSVASFIGSSTEKENLIKESTEPKNDFQVFLRGQLELIQTLLN